jgi:CubicO group peptidase (beta-lactamase class C family)
MNKKLISLIIILFATIIIDQSRNILHAEVITNNSFYLNKNTGINLVTLNRISSIVNTGIKSKAFPGCQIFVMKDGKPIYDKCFGNFTYETSEKVTPTTMFDLASLSKTTGTLLAIMKLYDDGKLRLADKVSMYLPFLQGTDKENITIAELLFHESGLPASLACYHMATTKDTVETVRMGISKYKKEWVSKFPSNEYTLQVSDSFYLRKNFHEKAMQSIVNMHLKSKTYLYSCVNFILLKEVAEAVSGTPMDVFLDKVFYIPMGLNHIAYLPLRTHKKEEIAPTLKRDFLRNGILQGYVHDPDAALLGGISGNAGLFASAGDVAQVYQMLLNHGELNGKRYLSTETCRIFTTTVSASGRRGLGFDKPVPSNPGHSACYIFAPLAVYGHTGYTGTCCWVDPVNNLIYVFLSNRTYPNDGVNKLAKLGIRTKIQEIIYQSIKQNK